MASRYWVGGTGTWDATTTTNWSTASGGAGGASAPTVADDAIFDANSNTGTNDFTVTLTGSPACLTLNTTGIDPVTAMTVAGTGNLEVRGVTFTLTNKVSWTNTGTISFTNTAATTINFTSAGVTIASNINMNPGALATLNFVDALTCTGSFTLSRGTVTTTSSNKNITIKSLTSATAGSKTMNTGTGTFSITGNAATVLDVITGGGPFTWTTPTTIRFTYSGATGTRTVSAANGINFSDLTGVTFLVTAGTDIFVFTANNSIGPLNFTGFSGTWNNVAMTINGNLTISTGMTLGSGTGILTLSATTLITNGKTFDFPVTSNVLTLTDGLTLGSTRTFTLSSGTLSLQNTTLSTGIFSSSGATVRSVTRTTGNITITGNNTTVLTLTGTGTSYASGLTFTCNYSGATGTRTINMTESGVNVNISAGTDIVTFTSGNSVAALNFTGFSGTWSNITLTIRGNLTVSTGMTVGAASNIVTFGGTGTITSNGKTLGFPITINGTSITVTVSGSLTIGASDLTLTSGTFNANNNNITCGTFSSSGSSARTLALGSGTWTVILGGSLAWDCSTSTNMTVTGTGKISMTSSIAKTFAGGGLTWPILEQAGAGALTISGNNTFTTIQNSVQPTTITFTSGSTQTVSNFNVNGTAGNLVTLNSSSAGSQATLSDASGTISVNYVSITDSAATGGATWLAYTSNGNVDGGNNTGWVFSQSSGNFLIFM